MKALVLENWHDLNAYFDAGWTYVDSFNIEKSKGECTHYVILAEEHEIPRITINRCRK